LVLFFRKKRRLSAAKTFVSDALIATQSRPAAAALQTNTVVNGNFPALDPDFTP
jgi:hypothetical protein